MRTRSVQVFHRFGLAAMACAAGIFLVVGCDERQADPAHVFPAPESATQGADATTTTDGWVEMETLAPGKWAAIEGAAHVEWDGQSRIMRIGVGTDLNGVRWTGPMPATPYEVELEARRMSGSDFFCGLTFPVRACSECASLIVGGWGGGLVGISSINGLDASENSTATQQEFEDKRWYRIRLVVEDEHLQAWIDDRQVVDAYTEEQKLSLRTGPIEACAPFGLATWLTGAEARGVKWRKLGD